MSAYASKDLPKWLQHANGDIPDPTPEEIEADRLESEKALEYFNKHGKWDAKSADGLDALNAYYSSMGQPEGNWLARVDWNLVFVVVARFMSAVAMAFVTFQFGRYFQHFGPEAIAFIGQYLIGCFFLYAVLTSEDSVKLLSGSFGMYLLLNSF